MDKDRAFNLKKAQIENFLKSEFRKKFRTNAKISVRKRQRFIQEVTKKIGRKFGKDVLCLVDFTKQGFVTLASPAHTESTDKGMVFRSFSHPQVYYTSHCVERFSQRTETQENCVISLDVYMNDALLSFGEWEGFLTCPAGIFAYVFENDRLIVKTFINFEMLSEEQIRKFYGPGMISTFPEEYLTMDAGDSDFILADEQTHLTKKPRI